VVAAATEGYFAFHFKEREEQSHLAASPRFDYDRWPRENRYEERTQIGANHFGTIDYKENRSAVIELRWQLGTGSRSVRLEAAYPGDGASFVSVF
jgi:hypothetical protein